VERLRRRPDRAVQAQRLEAGLAGEEWLVRSHSSWKAASRPGAARKLLIEPWRSRLTQKDYADLVSSLALTIGWEAFIVLLDVRGLSPARARSVTLRTTDAILAAAAPVDPRSRLC
jgi:hypothetical protein